MIPSHFWWCVSDSISWAFTKYQLWFIRGFAKWGRNTMCFPRTKMTHVWSSLPFFPQRYSVFRVWPGWLPPQWHCTQPGLQLIDLQATWGLYTWVLTGVESWDAAETSNCWVSLQRFPTKFWKFASTGVDPHQAGSPLHTLRSSSWECSHYGALTEEFPGCTLELPPCHCKDPGGHIPPLLANRSRLGCRTDTLPTCPTQAPQVVQVPRHHGSRQCCSGGRRQQTCWAQLPVTPSSWPLQHTGTSNQRWSRSPKADALTMLTTQAVLSGTCWPNWPMSESRRCHSERIFVRS